MSTDVEQHSMAQEIAVAIVDPDPAITEALTALLTTYNINVTVFPDAKTFLDTPSCAHLSSNYIMIETLLPDMSALSLLREIRSRGSAVPVIILSNGGSDQMRRQAIEFGATDVIEKSLVHDFLMGR